MIHQWDEFSKSLAEPVPRRESLRRLGIVLAGAVLSPLGQATAWARGPDRCKSFCKCSNKSQQTACFAACNACSANTTNLCGSCGSYVCRDLLHDFDNCGACGHICPQPGSYESGACVNGKCTYTCVAGAKRCNGTCTYVYGDPGNCGACGNVCGGATPFCSEGKCVACETVGLTNCNGSCTDANSDPNNCGACGNVCPDTAPNCNQGVCFACDPGYTWCPTQGVCANLGGDTFNCGECGYLCSGNEICSFGQCWPPYYPPY